VPTGVAIHDARARLFDAAERVLLRDGPSALTSRAVTSEAGCAKGVLHRHFADFDAFLAELVLNRIGRIEMQGAALRDAAGTGSVAGNLADALSALFDSVAREILGLVISRHDLLDRLRLTTPTGIPVMNEGAAIVASYLAAEQQLGRVAPDADIGTLAPTLIGTAHMLLAGREGTATDRETIHKAVATVIAGAL
jgi:AcrR family transcriptional regulator